jgi:hypothetical protein
LDTASQARPSVASPPQAGSDSGRELAGRDDGLLHLSRARRERRDTGRRQALEHMALRKKSMPLCGRPACKELGEREPVYRGKPAGDADSLKNRVGGDDLALRRLEIDESRDIAKYSQQLKELGDEPSLSILNRVIEDEQEHYRELSSLIRRYPAPCSCTGGESKSAAGADADQAQPGPPAHRRMDRRRHLRSQRRAGIHLRHRLRRFRRDPGQQQVCAALRDRRHDRQRALHGLRRLPRRQERARNL